MEVQKVGTGLGTGRSSVGEGMMGVVVWGCGCVWRGVVNAL